MWRSISVRPILAFLIISLLLRCLSFFYAVIDHDESTYIVIASQILEGKSLYVDVWDTKPAGIFIIFAIILKLLGGTIFSVRLTAAVVVAFSAYFLHRVLDRLKASRDVSLFAGVLYIVLMSSYRFGMAVNTEVFFNFFVISGLLVYLRSSSLAGKWVAGLLWGAGFMVKYVVLFDVFALLLTMFITGWLTDKKGSLLKWISDYLITGIGFLIPFAACNAYFYATGTYDAFYEATFEVPGRYKSEIIWGDAVNFILKFHLKFLPVMILFYIGLFNKSTASFGRKRMAAAWFFMVWIPVIIPGKFFDHYFAQLLLPVSWLSAEAVGTTFLREWIIKQRKWISFAIPLVVVALIYGNQAYFYTRNDDARDAAEYMNAKLNPGETIYAGKRLQILYFLTHTDPPTKYVHPTLLTFASHVRTLGVEPEEEFEKIILKKPRFVIFEAPHPNGYFNKKVMEEYIPVKNYRRGVVLFEHRETISGG